MKCSHCGASHTDIHVNSQGQEIEIETPCPVRVYEGLGLDQIQDDALSVDELETLFRRLGSLQACLDFIITRQPEILGAMKAS